MKSIVRARQLAVASILAAAAAAALLGAGPAQAGLFGKAKPKIPVYVPPPVSLPARVVQAAAVYEAYVDSASAITAQFADGATVSSKVRIGAAYEAQQMQRGEAAYAAIAALQDPAFVAAVRVYAADASSRTLVVGEIMKDPAYVLGIKGADSAAALAAHALDAHGMRVRVAGERVKQSAYDVQKQAWSKVAVTDRDGRMAEAKALSLSPRTASPEAVARLQMASSGQAPMPLMGGTSLTGPAPEKALPLIPPQVTPSALTPASTGGAPATLTPPYTPLVTRGLAAAALAVLGEGGEANSDTIWAVLNEPNQGMCFNMAKLNLYQCLSVAKPYYEDVFCLGQHILIDTGQCIVRGAGVQKIAPVVLAERPSAVAYTASKTPVRRAASKKPAGKKK